MQKYYASETLDTENDEGKEDSDEDEWTDIEDEDLGFSSDSEAEA